MCKLSQSHAHIGHRKHVDNQGRMKSVKANSDNDGGPQSWLQFTMDKLSTRILTPPSFQPSCLGVFRILPQCFAILPSLRYVSWSYCIFPLISKPTPSTPVYRRCHSISKVVPAHLAADARVGVDSVDVLNALSIWKVQNRLAVAAIHHGRQGDALWHFAHQLRVSRNARKNGRPSKMRSDVLDVEDTLLADCLPIEESNRVVDTPTTLSRPEQGSTRLVLAGTERAFGGSLPMCSRAQHFPGQNVSQDILAVLYKMVILCMRHPSQARKCSRPFNICLSGC